MAKGHSFFSLHRQGMIRAGVCTPAVTVADPAANAAATIALAQKGDAEGADLLVFPELNVTSYAIDDLHLQDAILDATEAGIAAIVEASAKLKPVLLIGAALRRNGRLYNCALAIARGRILGVVPKQFLPNYREYYEKRWFASGLGLAGLDITVAGQTAPFGSDLIFAASDLEDFVFHIEICEDYWAPTPPSTDGALAGALVLCNLSASNIVIGKGRERELLCASQSARTLSAYLYSASGPGESTTDLAWDGQGLIYEFGELLARSERFELTTGVVYADLDLERLRLERMRDGTFNDSTRYAGQPEMRFRRIAFAHRPDMADRGLVRPLRRFPFVPNTPARLEEDCYEAFNIQVEGLRKRLESTGSKHLVIGVSGGLDSTHALIVACKAMDRLGRPRSDILGFTMPGFATGDATKSNAWALMRALGVTGEEIDIRPTARQMLADLGHPFAEGQPVYDVTFENVQAGLRTDYLFRLANQRQGFVVGTGDLSELALGWCTYGVGDQMSHYTVNSGVPKTLIQYLIRWTVSSAQFTGDAAQVLTAILDTEISPELVPPDAEGKIQSTQDRIGPYELHDFFLHYVVRHGLRPSKIAFLAWHAWRDRNAGLWPIGFPEAGRSEYDLETIAKWLETFLFRFFQTSQFKRSALPNGPKVSPGGALSPRGDWRAPSDSVATTWIEELRRALP
ncbi:NAD(+) synthase [Sphingomonas psychrotolerans]|uniref:Glutamine-dependent NAD(+) synthetase n=1 Tax=Sphingomonas psychrotolerans TaxID=1327635 RepID=A0ABU3MYP5_9SPHN|nr:NAD(+) synthase [Sphingomonas psychrotolerans]MDT8757439.1 NAD(+) synthase [Sphingomonas psychrotolerans]